MVSLTGQMYAFFVTVVAGLSVGLLFDLYRVFRSAIGPKRWVSMVCDIGYWLVVTPVVFLLLLVANWADLRYYVAIGMGLGLFAYFQLLSPFILWTFVNVNHGVGTLFGSLGRLLLGATVLPFRLLGGLGLGRSSFLHSSGRRPRTRAPRMRWRTWSPGRIFRQ